MTESDIQDQTVLDQGPDDVGGADDPQTTPGSMRKFLRHYNKGDLIFEQDDEGTTMYFIQSGRVRISKVTQKRIQPLAILEAGSFFGEMAVLSGDARTARAEALSDATLLEIDRDILDDFLSSHPHVSRRMIHVLSERLRNTDELVERLLDGDPMIQVVGAIIDLTEDSEQNPPYISDIQELMVKSATDPRLLRWVLKRLRDARFISADEGGIRVGQRSRLQEYLNFLSMQQDMLRPNQG